MRFVFIMDVLPDEHGNLTDTNDGVTSLVLLVVFRVRLAASNDILNYEYLIFQRIFDIFLTNSNAFVQKLPRNKEFVLSDISNKYRGVV